MVVIMEVVGILLSTLMSIIVTLSTITIKTKETPLTVLITTSIRGISILPVKGAHAHQHRKLVVDQGLRLPTGRQQNLQHHQDEPKVETHHLIKPHHLTELRRHRLAGHQRRRQIDLHHQTDLLPQIDHPHHHAHLALAVLAEVEVEDDKFFLYYILKKKRLFKMNSLFFLRILYNSIHHNHQKAYRKHSCL